MPDFDRDRHRLVGVSLDPASIARATPDVEHERAAAIYDLIEDNRFALPNHAGGPYRLVLGIVEQKLVFDVRDADDGAIIVHALSLNPFRRIVKDYFLICDSYYKAIRTASPSQIEAIDMGRRGVHDEGSQILAERLQGKIALDHDTARRLFTLICALHWKG